MFLKPQPQGRQALHDDDSRTLSLGLRPAVRLPSILLWLAVPGPSTSCAARWEPGELAAPPLPAVPGIWGRGPGRPGPATILRSHRTLSLTQCLGIFLLVLSRFSERAWGPGISLVGHCVFTMATQ